MMGWSRAQPFDQLQERARRDLLFTQIRRRQDDAAEAIAEAGLTYRTAYSLDDLDLA